MSKGSLTITFTALLLGSPIALAAGPSDYYKHTEFRSCKTAVQQALGNRRSVHVSSGYWIDKRRGQNTKVFLNAHVHPKRKSMRGTCDMRRNGVVANVETAPGRFVTKRRGKVSVELADRR